MNKRQEGFARRAAGFRLASWEQIPDLGLYMDQVITFIQRQLAPLFPDVEKVVTPSMVNNYVKMGLISRPEGKKYGREQLAQLTMLCMLKQSATAEEMKVLLGNVTPEDTQAFYEDFGQTQHEIFQELCGRLPLPSPINCALRASAYRLLLEEVAVKEGKEGIAKESDGKKSDGKESDGKESIDKESAGRESGEKGNTGKENAPKGPPAGGGQA